MPNQQLEDLGTLTSATLAADDAFLVNDDSDTTNDAGGEPKTITAGELRLYASELTLDAEYNAGLGNVAKTLVVGKLTPVDLGANNGGSLAANVVITLPSAADGDVCGLLVTRKASVAGSFPLAPGYCAEIANATRINDAAYTYQTTGSGKWGLWMPGEFLVFRYLGTGYGTGTAGWYVVHDGRIPFCVHLNRNGSNQTLTDAAWTKVQWTTAALDNGSLFDSTNYGLKLKRTNHVNLAASAVPTTTGVNLNGVRITDGSTPYLQLIDTTGGSVNTAPRVSALNVSYALNTLIYVDAYFDVASGSPTLSGAVGSSNFAACEVLN